jgi:hypothetical protein
LIWGSQVTSTIGHTNEFIPTVSNHSAIEYSSNSNSNSNITIQLMTGGSSFVQNHRFRETREVCPSRTPYPNPHSKLFTQQLPCERRNPCFGECESPFQPIAHSATIPEHTTSTDVDTVINDEHYPNPYQQNKMNSDGLKLQNLDKRKKFLNPKIDHFERSLLLFRIRYD